MDKYIRLVVYGSKQVSGTDYTNSFAPVVKHTRLRIYLAIEAVHRMHAHWSNMESALIYAQLHEDVYTHPHPAMNVPKGHRVKLLESLCGSKQLPHN